MADAVVGDMFLLTANGVYAQQRIMLTHNYRLIAIDPGITVELATSTLIKGVRAGAGGSDLWETKYLAALPPQYTLDNWQAQLIEPQRFVPVNFTRNVAGTHAGDTETGNQAAVITLRTEKSGRNQVSNKHIGPIPQDVAVQDDGLVTAAYKTILGTLATALLANYQDAATGAIFQPVINHHTSPVVTYDPLKTYVLGSTLRVMRRRTVGLGI